MEKNIRKELKYMNLNNFTIKAQEAVQQAVQLVTKITNRLSNRFTC